MPLHQTINTEHALRTVRQPANNSGPEMIVLSRCRFDLWQHPVAFSGRTNAFTPPHLDEHMGRLAGGPLVPLHGLAIGLAVAVNARNFDDGDRGQGGCVDQLASGSWPICPDCSSWRSNALRPIFSAPVSPKARAISRFPTTDGDV